MTADGEAVESNPAAPLSLAEVLAGGAQPTGIPPISGFWRRLTAFLLDGIFLGIAGQLLALSMSSVLFEIGPYGRIAGQFLALLYFALLNSSIGGGQTLGKRVMRIAVRNGDGQEISVGRSMLRTSIWIIPATLNGLRIPLINNPIAGSVATVILFGIGGAVVVTMLFNRRSRQGLHDMLTHTYVLHLGGIHVDALPTASRRQWIVSGVMVSIAVAAIIAGVIFGPRLLTRLQPIGVLQHAIEADSRFFEVGVSDQTIFGGRERHHVLLINVWLKGLSTDDERNSIMNDIAREALTMPDVDRYDLIRINLESAYDLGIAWGRSGHFDGETVSTWRGRVASSSAH
jgi:uncharacterized RDD family membrane protein YckC